MPLNEQTMLITWFLEKFSLSKLENHSNLMKFIFQGEKFSSPTTTTEPSPASSTESLLMSFLGGFLPFISSDSDHKTAGSNDEDDKNIVNDDYDRQDVLGIKRLGLAAEVGDVESKR